MGTLSTSVRSNTLENLVSFLERSSATFYVHDLQGRFLKVDGSTASTGYTREELESLNIRDLLDDKDAEVVQDQIHSMIESRAREAIHYLLQIRTKSGKKVWLEVEAGVIWRDGSPFAIEGIARECKHRFAVGDIVKGDEEQLRALAELAPAAVFIYCEDRFAWANHSTELLTGYTAEELSGMSIVEVVASEDRGLVARNADARIFGESAPSRYEFRIQRKSGEICWIDFSAAMIQYEGKPAVFGTAIDITSRKRAEEAVRKGEELFRNVIESSTDIISILSDEGTVRYVSPAVTRLLGWTPEELIGTNAFALVHPDDLELALAAARLGIEDYRKNPPVEIRVRQTDGTFRPFEAASSHYFEGGERKGLVCSFRAISDRKKAELDLRESERKYRFLFERNVAGVYLSRVDGRILDCNDSMAKSFGYSSRHDLIHNNAATLYFNPEDRARFIETLRQLGSVNHFESRCRRQDGSSVWILENAMLFEPEPGGEKIVQGAVLDITERKRSEDLQSALYRIASLTNSSIDSRDYFRSLHRILCDLMYAENMYIAVLDKTGSRLQFRYFSDRFDENPVEREVGKGLTEYVLRTGKPLLADEELCHRLESDGEIELLGPPSLEWMASPLQSGSSAIGVIAIQSYTEHHHYTNSDLEVLTFVAQHIGSAIDRERHQQALRESEERHRSLIERAVYGIYRASVRDRFLEVNPALVRMLGYDSQEELLTISLSRQLFEDAHDSQLLIERYERDRRIENFETRWLCKDGQTITVRLSGRVLYDDTGGPSGFEMIVEDISERRALEHQLRHSQKMEAVGQLAGGIAHDFNNLLTVIKGYSELLLEQVSPPSPLRHQLDEINLAATRAAGLTGQLLAFSRQQVLSPRLMDLNAVITSMEGLLMRLVGESIRMTLNLDPNLGSIEADPSQIEQIVMNLAMNARDAVGASGEIVIETSNSNGNVHQTAGCKEGSFVTLSVRDNGVGMPDEVRSRIFEPFFTTKEIGKGTGLGLSTVYGIVQQNKATISVKSAPGLGTTFRVNFPRQDAVVGPATPDLEISSNIQAGGTVLLVEDEDGVRSLVREVLERRGFQILEARHPGEAILLCERHEGAIDLLLTDIVLEQLNGIELAQRLAPLRPGMQIVYMSGYAVDTIAPPGVLTSENFLSKPFSAEMLMLKISQVLQS